MSKQDKTVVDTSTTEDTTTEETVDETKENKSVKSPDEIRAEAEALEAENKQIKKDREAKNYEGRLEKARRENEELKLESQSNNTESETKKTSPEFTTRDLIALDKVGYEEDSDEAKLIQSYISGGLVTSVTEALNHRGVKAELEDILTERTAAATIDENDTEEGIAQSKQEIINQYETSGRVPMINGEPDPKAIEVIAAHNRQKSKPGH